MVMPGLPHSPCFWALPGLGARYYDLPWRTWYLPDEEISQRDAWLEFWLSLYAGSSTRTCYSSTDNAKILKQKSSVHLLGEMLRISVQFLCSLFLLSRQQVMLQLELFCHPGFLLRLMHRPMLDVWYEW